MDESAAATKTPKHRSPSYPAYDLETSLARAKQLHELAKTHPANVALVVREWGYSPKSSKGLLMIAALKKFALADDAGKGDARTLFLTPLGRELVYFENARTSEEWRSRAQIAAMTPTIHRELWTRYDGRLPTDGVMKDYLVLTRNFSESAAEEVLGEFRRTLAFVGIGASDEPDMVNPDRPEVSEEQDQTMSVTAAQPQTTSPAPHVWPPAPAAPDTKAQSDPSGPLPVNVNLSGDGWATLRVSGRLSEIQWQQLMTVLNAMKPGLVTPDQ
jgi:hypothetical protein